MRGRIFSVLLVLLAACVVLGVGAFVFIAPHTVSVKITATTSVSSTPVPVPPVSTPTTNPPLNVTPFAKPDVCIKPGALSEPYANAPHKAGGPDAFGPKVIDDTQAVLGRQPQAELYLRLCGVPGGHGPDERLWAAIDAVVNHTNPNAVLSRSVWAHNVDKLTDSQIDWANAHLATLQFAPGSSTMEMVPGSFPIIKVAPPSTYQKDLFLVVRVRANSGSTVTLALRLKCGFQPYLQYLLPISTYHWPTG
jgi:hypothetical protein